MKNYSFSNIASEQSYGTRKSNDFSNLYRHSQLKTSEANLRIEEIKKKYDTPSRRQRIESLKKSKDYDVGSRVAKQQTRDSIYQQRPPPTFGNNHLKQSFAVNRLEKSRLKNQIQSKEFINLRAGEREYRRSNEKQNDFGPYVTHNREEEQAIFSKVREMKESIINNDYMKSSINGKSSIKSNKYPNYTDSKFDGKKQVDPRVQNIDKINSKIKHILSSLSENEKNPKYGKESSVPSYMKDSATASYLKDSGTASYLKDSGTASYLKDSGTASYLKDSGTASYLKDPTVPSYTKDITTPSYLKNSTPSYLKQSNQGSFLKDTTFACDKQETITPNKQSAFFGIKGKDISQSKKSYDSHLHKNSDVVQKYNIYDPKPSNQQMNSLPQQNQRTNKYELQKYNKYEPYCSKSNLDYQKYKNKDYSVNKVEYSKDYSANKYEPYSKEYSVSRPPKRTQQILRTPTYLSKYQIQSKALRGSRSKSQIDSFKKSTIATNQNGDQLRSGKKLNDQISKIQKKIEQFQKEKRRLNIQFTPFTLKNKSTANLNGDKSEGTKQPQKNNEQSRDTSKNVQRSSSYDYKFKSYMNRAANYQQKYGDFNNKSKEITPKQLPPRSSSIYDNIKPKYTQPTELDTKNQQIQISTVRIDDSVENNQQKNMNEVHLQIDEVAIKKRTDQGIQLRRKRLQGGQDQIIKSQSLKKLVLLFCQQVKLDQNLRNLKIWFQSSFQTQKNNLLLRALEKQGLKLTLRECETIFTVDESQHNPFFSVQNFEGSFQALALAYVQSENHWKTKIQHKFQKNSLLSQGFSWQKIDLERKDYIELEDLVRFLNIESGTFYRNRDLFLIFRRFSSTEKLKFEAMLSQISA